MKVNLAIVNKVYKAALLEKSNTSKILPYLKRREVGWGGANSKLRLWYVKMIYNHTVYVLLLLKISNDVEKNSGPMSINDSPSSVLCMLILRQ